MKMTLIAFFTLLSSTLFAGTYPTTREQAIAVFDQYFAKGICSSFQNTGAWDYFCGDDRDVYDYLYLLDGTWQIEVRASQYHNEYYAIENDGSVSMTEVYFE